MTESKHYCIFSITLFSSEDTVIENNGDNSDYRKVIILNNLSYFLCLSSSSVSIAMALALETSSSVSKATALDT